MYITPFSSHNSIANNLERNFQMETQFVNEDRHEPEFKNMPLPENVADIPERIPLNMFDPKRIYKTRLSVVRQEYPDFDYPIDSTACYDIREFECDKSITYPFPSYSAAYAFIELKKMTERAIMFKFMYDVEYKPDFESNDTKYFVCYDYSTKKHVVCTTQRVNYSGSVYFSSSKVAEKFAEYMDYYFEKYSTNNTENKAE